MRLVVVTTTDNRDVRMVVAEHDIGYMFDVLNASPLTSQVRMFYEAPTKAEQTHYAKLVSCGDSLLSESSHETSMI